MKKLLSLAMVVALTISMGIIVFTAEAERTDISKNPSVNEEDNTAGKEFTDECEIDTFSTRRQMLTDKYEVMFDGDAEKMELFLDTAAGLEFEDAEMDSRELNRAAEKIRYSGIETATPISVVRQGRGVHR